MQIFRDADALRRAVGDLRRDGARIALVPTMGALHAGHMALVTEARRHADHVVASVFVNPTQFGPSEDFASYPRQEDEDAAMLAAHGCAILWAPPPAVMYPGGHATRVQVAGVSEGLCGEARRGHFDGVATVVSILFHQVQPDVALFGEKDYQQLAVIRRMVRDLAMPIQIVGVPTQRDADGLARSSRNAYLSAEERIAARTLPRVLGETTCAIQEGADVAAVLERAKLALAEAGFGPIDYVELCDADSLAPLATLDRPARLLAAAYLGRTRLIDNLAVVQMQATGKNLKL